MGKQFKLESDTYNENFSTLEMGNNENFSAQHERLYGHTMAAIALAPYKDLIQAILDSNVFPAKDDDIEIIFKEVQVDIEESTKQFIRRFVKQFSNPLAARAYLQIIELYENGTVAPELTRDELREYALFYVQRQVERPALAGGGAE